MISAQEALAELVESLARSPANSAALLGAVASVLPSRLGSEGEPLS